MEDGEKKKLSEELIKTREQPAYEGGSEEVNGVMG